MVRLLFAGDRAGILTAARSAPRAYLGARLQLVPASDDGGQRPKSGAHNGVAQDRQFPPCQGSAPMPINAWATVLEARIAVMLRFPAISALPSRQAPAALDGESPCAHCRWSWARQLRRFSFRLHPIATRLRPRAS